MTDNTIDTLELQIRSDSQRAVNDLDKLSASLIGVSKASKRMETSGLVKATENIKKISNSLSGINNFRTPDFSGLVQEFGKLKDIDVSKSVASLTASFARLSNAGEKARITANQIPNIGKALEESVKGLNGIEDVSKPINSFVSSISRLSNAGEKAQLSAQNLPIILSGLKDGISELSGIGDIDTGINRFVSSLARLSNAGEKSAIVSQQLPTLGTALYNTANKMASAGSISDSVNLFTQSIGRLASAGSKTGETAAGLDNLAQETLKFFQTMAKAPKISQNTLKMTQALAQLASAGGKVSTTTGTITSSFNKLSGLGSKTASAIKKAAKGISSSLSQIGSSSKHLNTASFSFGKLLKSALPFIGFREIFNWGKQAVETASSLTEVQNVVDVAFGDMKQKVEDFASTSIEDFGMSELTAKEIASRYQAMGNAMGIPVSKFSKVSDILKKNNAVYGESVDSMADMSVELTKLAADMASFYNMKQSDVAKNLQSVFTGEAEPLRKYGLDLTNATVQEWALKQGLDANMQSMTQAEKTLLRYQYVMSNSTAAMHDFRRTQDSWANQTRILSQRFQELGSVVGGTLINALKPLVKALNSVMGKVIEFARTVSEALGAIFGWKIEVDTGGITNDLDSAGTSAGDLADSADDAAGGLGDASGAAQKLKKTLSVLPFDQLNQLASNMSNAGSGGSGGAGSGGLGDSGVNAGAGASANLVQTDSLFEKYKSEIENLEQLGEYIGDALIKAMQSIDWESVYESARNFGTGFADFLNGLISPELFYETARLVANSINTAFYALNSFAREFDWTNLGNSLSAGINSFFQNWNAGLTGATFNNFTNGLIDAIAAATDSESGINWSMIGTKVRTMVYYALNGIKWEEAYRAAGNFGSGLAIFLNNLITPGTFEQIGHTISGGLKSALSLGIGFISEFDWYNATMSLSTALTTFITDINWVYYAKVFGFQIKRALRGISDGIADTDWYAIGQDISDFITGIPFTELLSGVGELIWEAINAGIDLFKGMFGIDTIEEKINGLDKDLNLSQLTDGIKALGESLSPFVKGFAEGFIDVIDFLANKVTPAVISDLGTAFKLLGDALNAIPPEVMEELGKAFGEIGASLIVIKGANTAITSLKGLFSFLGGTKTATDAAKKGLSDVGKAVGDAGTAASEAAKNAVDSTKTIEERINSAKEVTGKATDAFGKFQGTIMNLGATVTLQDMLDNLGRELDGTADKTRATDEALGIVAGAMNSVGIEGDILVTKLTNITSPMNHLANEDAPEFSSAFQEMITNFENAGGSADELKNALSIALSSGLITTKEYADEINKYINGTGTSFENTSGKIADASINMTGEVGGISGVLSGLNDTSLISIAKFALLSGALKSLADNGTISKDQFGELNTNITNAKEAGSGFDSIILYIDTALSNAGVSAGELNSALLNSADSMKNEYPEAIEDVVSTLNGLSVSFESAGLDSGKNYASGTVDGINQNTENVKKATESMISEGIVNATQKSLDSHSPSKVAEGFGRDYDTGIANGITGYAEKVNYAAKTMLDKMKEIFPTYNRDFYNFGMDYISEIGGGMNAALPNLERACAAITKLFKDAFGGIASNLYTKGQDAAIQFANGITSVHIPMPHISVEAQATKTENGYSYNMGSYVNWYALGGLFSKASVIGVGEAGKEAVLPLDNKRTMSMIADSILTNASGIGIDEEILTNAVARGVAMAMINNAGNSNSPEYIQNSIYLDGDVMARAVTKAQKERDSRFNPTPQFGY